MKNWYIPQALVLFLFFGTYFVQVCGSAEFGFYGQLAPLFVNPVALCDCTVYTKAKDGDPVPSGVLDEHSVRFLLEIIDRCVPKNKVDGAAIRSLEKFCLLRASGIDIAKKFLPGATWWGKIAFAETCMASPGYVKLIEQQNVTRCFVNNSDLRTKCARAFKLIKAGHQAYLSYFDPVDEVTRLLRESVYFGRSIPESLNGSATALAGLEMVQWARSVILFATISGLLPCVVWATSRAYGKLSTEIAESSDSWIELAKVAGQVIGRGSVDGVQRFARVAFYTHCPIPFMSPEACEKGIDTFFSRGTVDAFNGLIPSVHDIFNAVRTARGSIELPRPVVVAMAFLCTYGAVACLDALIALAAKQVVDEVRQTNGILAHYQERLIGAAKILRGLEMLDEVARDAGNETLQLMASDIRSFLDLSGPCGELLSILRTDTFAHTVSFFSNHGRILVANRLMEGLKGFLVKPLLAAGKIELLVSAADFFISHQGAVKSVCFVEFVNDKEPRLELENVWSLFLDERCAVCSPHMQLGKNGAPHLILSGPNGTGKSTSENAIAHTIFLGRLGIACASRAVMTPFEICEIYRDELEDLATSRSTFMVQKQRFDELCWRIAHLKNERMIVFMDEPLSGTVEAEAGRILYEAGKTLFAKQRQAITVIATHAERPTRLEADTGGIFANYYLEIAEPVPGHFVRTYRLVPGIPEWWFYDAERRHMFVEWLSRERETR